MADLKSKAKARPQDQEGKPKDLSYDHMPVPAPEYKTRTSTAQAGFGFVNLPTMEVTTKGESKPIMAIEKPRGLKAKAKKLTHITDSDMLRDTGINY